MTTCMSVTGKACKKSYSSFHERNIEPAARTYRGDHGDPTADMAQLQNCEENGFFQVLGVLMPVGYSGTSGQGCERI